VAQVVPYRLPLTEPQISVELSESHFRDLARAIPLPPAVRLYLCRDRLATLEAVLAPSSVVLVGGRRRWVPTPERGLARRLRRAGLEVVFADRE
jgi:hypothetical protein